MMSLKNLKNIKGPTTHAKKKKLIIFVRFSLVKNLLYYKNNKTILRLKSLFTYQSAKENFSFEFTSSYIKSFLF